MFRFALTAYLILTTVLRPSLCCCLTEQLLPGTACCHDAVASQPAAPTDHKPHKNCRGHAKPQKQSSRETLNHSEKQRSPCENDGSTCPCGKRFASMAVAASAGFQHCSIEGQNQAWTEHFLTLSVLPVSDAQNTSLLAHSRHSDRYGREMLRAYEIMRC